MLIGGAYDRCFSVAMCRFKMNAGLNEACYVQASFKLEPHLELLEDKLFYLL
jgi:hypothetical protein